MNRGERERERGREKGERERGGGEKWGERKGVAVDERAREGGLLVFACGREV